MSLERLLVRAPGVCNARNRRNKWQPFLLVSIPNLVLCRAKYKCRAISALL